MASEGRVSNMKIFIISVLVCILCFPLAAIARRDTGPPEWTFDDVAELDDWNEYHNLAPASIITKVQDSRGTERTVFSIASMGDNPYIYPGGQIPSWEPFSGYDHGVIYIGLRVSESDMWRIDYVTGRSDDFSEASSRQFKIDATKDFVDLELDMQWENMIRGFRIHPGTNKNKFSEIDYVSLRGPVTVTQARKKLATTWGRVKDLF